MRIVAPLVLILSVLNACGASDTNARQGGKPTVASKLGSAFFRLSAGEVTGLTRVNVQVSGDGISSPISTDLSPSDDSFSGKIAAIPAGSIRLFEANAYQGSEIACSGSAEAPVSAGETTQVSIILQCEPGSGELGEVEITGGFNFPPVINWAYADKATVPVEEEISLMIRATDPNGDALTYMWQVTAGVLSNADATTTTWTAPLEVGNYKISIQVTDNRGGSTTLSLVIAVVNTSGMVAIPDGCFSMGDAFGEGDAAELPVHTVCLSQFAIDKYLVSNTDYKVCVSESGCTQPSDVVQYEDSAYGSHPVVYVSWDQATAYCTWAGKRLLTEAEWEYAARGGLSGKRYPWGDSIDCTKANYYTSDTFTYDTDPFSGAKYCLGTTNQVGSYAPNGFGLYDMAGNVWEWVYDYFGSYPSGTVTDPTGPTTGTHRAFRGGSMDADAYNQRVSFRYQGIPGAWSAGFRCAR